MNGYPVFNDPHILLSRTLFSYEYNDNLTDNAVSFVSVNFLCIGFLAFSSSFYVFQLCDFSADHDELCIFRNIK